MEEVCESRVKFLSDLTALEGTRSCVNGDFGHGSWDARLSGLTLEDWAALEEVGDFVDDEWDIGFEGLGRELDLHEFLLLHELAVWAVVDDVGAEDWGGEAGVDLFRVDVLELAVEDEFVALGADVDGRLLAEEDEREDIAMLGYKLASNSKPVVKGCAYLLSVALKEPVWVHTIGDSVTNDWQPVEDHGWLIRVLEEQLAQNIEYYSESNKSGETSKAHESNSPLLDLCLNRREHRSGNLLNETHCTCMLFYEQKVQRYMRGCGVVEESPLSCRNLCDGVKGLFVQSDRRLKFDREMSTLLGRPIVIGPVNLGRVHKANRRLAQARLANYVATTADPHFRDAIMGMRYPALQRPSHERAEKRNRPNTKHETLLTMLNNYTVFVVAILRSTKNHVPAG